MGGGGGGCEGGGGGGLPLGGCGAGCFLRTAPSREDDAEASGDLLCLSVDPCVSVGDVCRGGEDVLGGSGGGGGEPDLVAVGVTEVTVVRGIGEEKELDEVVGDVLVVGGENCGGENCMVGGLEYLEGGTA